MAARKWMLIASQSVYVSLFACLSFGVLLEISPRVVGGSSLPYLMLGAAVLLAGMALVTFTLLSRGRLATRFWALLTLIPVDRLRSWLGESRSKFSATDGELERFFATAFRSPLPLLTFLVGWLIEAAETALILYLLGVRLPLHTVGAMEVASSFIRNAAFVLPAGLGVQDLSYLAFLRALGVPDALNVAAAFLLLKRCKEAIWAALGYALLALDLRPVSSLRARYGN
jgi:hypothetical protein